MNTRQSNAWWQEMGALSRGMMFIQGHIATPAALGTTGKSLQVPAASALGLRSASNPAPHGHRLARKIRARATRLLHDLELLGGRPMLAGHNDDIDEPLPPLHRRPGTTRRRPSPVAQGCTVYRARS